MDELDELLRNRIESAMYSGVIKIGNEVIYSRKALPQFYEKCAYMPAWIEGDGRLSKNASELIKAVKDSYMEGLNPGDYHIEKIELLTKYITGEKHGTNLPKVLVEIDILLTDVFLIYGSHLLAGKVNPETIDSEWIAVRREQDLTEVLQKALKENNIEKSLAGLLPEHAGYFTLREALSKYRSISEKGGWQKIPAGKVIKQGDIDSRIPVICERLSASGDLKGIREDIDLFDEAIKQSVEKFQERHGLEITGKIDDAAIKAMNVSVTERIRQIEVNLERWRWLPQNLGGKYVLVNIAGFELDVIDDKKKIMNMRIIVGRDYRRTPVFSDQITYLVFNPYWHVPQNIAVQDIIQKALTDPEYLSKQKIRVFQGRGSEAREIDPHTVEWDKLNENNFPYRLRQDPGPHNALGKVKFMFPNKFNVYLHDTSAPELFEKNIRTFSSGCIRIEKALELAEYLLNWSGKEIKEALNPGAGKTVKLKNPVPVHILYWTAWSDDNGKINFREDIYKRDLKLYTALKEKYEESK
ncbi:MAG: L,D-transpeptidase family protein [bacterium]